MPVYYYTDADDVLRHLDNHDDFTLQHAVHLEAVLTEVYAATQAAVHVITGALKSSGKMESEIIDDKWIGSITYGGPSTVPTEDGKTYVRYAEYEAQRGQEHDFLRPAYALDGMYERAIMDFLER